ncbi:MAG TPA: hypothetical protein PLB62_06450 [Candidatus Sumerlaeota bacterium]|nr:hypothetical protein [Candidatus Sumerlaeota bacterium]
MKKLILTGIACVIAGTLCILHLYGQPASDSSDKGSQKLIGSWHVTRAQTSLILSIEPDHEALVLWIQKGSHSTLRTSWEPVPGGILVHGRPRIRLWPGRETRDDELRAELEAIPELGYDPNKDFHDHFFMRRIRQEEVPLDVRNRPIPERWEKETLGEDWNQTAGLKPLPENTANAR